MAHVTVRRATSADAPLVAQILGRAMKDDPALAWATPHAPRREKYVVPYFLTMVKRLYLSKGEVHLTDDGLAAALWAPPGRWETPARGSLALLPTMLRSCRTTLPRALRMVAFMEAKHKERTEPHHHLAYLGAVPEARGQGRGSALLASVLERCDADRLPAYLEATSTGNRALYHRYGFETLEELHWPGGGPPFWPMWRTGR